MKCNSQFFLAASLGASLLFCTAAVQAAPHSQTSTAIGAATTDKGSKHTGSATGGSGGTAVVDGNSATTLGVGGTSATNNGGSSALGMGASGASVNDDANVHTRAAVHGNHNLNGQAMTNVNDKGTFARSHTHCKDKMGQSVNCRTKTMSHVPGQKPTMSTSTSDQPPL